MRSFASTLRTKFAVTNFLLAICFLFVNNVYGQTLISDSADYHPGSTCILTGTGFQPGETVTLQVLHANYQPGDTIGEDHEPWDIVADTNGNFTTTWHVCEDDCVGALLRATADGQNSTLHAETLFTDNVTLLTINSPTTLSPVSVPAGCAVTISYTYTSNNSGPAGTATITIGSTVVSGAQSAPKNGTFTNSITLTIPSATATGNYSVTVSIDQGNILSSTQTNAVTVTSALTTANAGTDESVCSSSGNISGNNPSIGTGMWSVVSGGASITNPNNRNTPVTNLAIGPNVFRWTISNGTCSNSDDVTITRNDKPTIAAISAPAALCAGASLNPATPTITTNGSAVTSQSWQLETAVGSGTFSNISVPYTVAFADNGKKIRYSATNGCGTTTSNEVTLTVNDKPAIAAISTPAALCAGLSLSPTTPAVTANGSTVTSQSWQLETAVGNGTFSNISVPYTLAFADNGKKIRYTATNVCGTTNSNEVTLTVNDKPTIAAISTPAALCAGGSLNPTTPTVTANGSTVTSQGWQLETAVGSGTFSDISVPYTVAFADNGKKIRYTATNGCGTTNGNQVTLTVNDKPTIAAISIPVALCTGASLNPATPTITANGSTVTSQSWQLETAVGSGSFSNISVPYTVAFADNGKKIRYSATNGCGTTNSNEVIVTVNPLPTVFNVSFTGSLCTSATITLSGSETGVNYTLFRNASSVETKPGTGSGLSFSPVTQSGTYTIVATNTTTTCSSTMNGDVDMGGGSPPATFTVTGGGSYCSGGAGVLVGLDDSETGVNYQLFLGINPVGSPVAGTGSAISFGNQTVAGTYTVVATKTSGGCTATMTGSVNVVINTAPSITATNLGPFNNTTNTCGTSVTLGSNVTVNAGSPAPTITYSLTNFGTTISNPFTFPVGPTTVYVKASNICGDDIESFTVTVNDVQAPSGSAPLALTGVNSCLPTQTQADEDFDATLAASGYSDNCGGVITATLTSAVVSGTKCGWTVTYTFSVKDQYNNTLSSQSYTRSGSDQTAPTGTNPTAITGVNSCLPTQAQADAAFDATLAAGGYSDACGEVVTAEIVSAVVSGTKCAWSILYTFKVKDECNNYTANQTYTRSGSDQTAPTGTAPTAITGVNSCLPTQAQADAAFDATLAAGGYSDACGGVVTAEIVSAVVSGTKCSWSILYTFRVKDECNNYTANQTYTRSGSDQTAPTGTNPTAITGVNSCLPTQTQADAAFDATLAAGGYSDACGGVVTAEIVSAVVSGTKCSWSILYTFRVKDECNNYTANQTYTRSGSDQTAPTGTNPTAITGVNSCLPTQTQADGAFDATLAAGGYSDACGEVVTAEIVSAVVSGTKCAWSILYTFKVKDECNNYTANQTYTRSGSDQTAPTGTAPTAITGVNSCLLTQAQADAAFDATLAAGGYSDACGGVVTAEMVSAVVSGTKCSWSILYTFKVKDECNNYTANQTYTRSGSDQTAPTGTNPTAITGVNSCLPTQAQADAAFDATLAAGGYSDACGGVVTAEMVSAVVSGTKCSWSILYTFKVKDECNNYTANQTYTRSGSDQTAPTGTNPTAITGVNSCLPTQTQADAAFDATLAAGGYSDACGGVVTAEMVSAVVSGTKCAWSILYTFRVKDECNNYTANQTYTRSGSDQTAPTGTNPTAITGVNSCLPTQTQADAAFDATLAAGGYSDACGGVVTAEMVSAVVSGTKCSWSILYTFKVKDECNNYTANQTYTRSGSDQTAPTGTNPTAITGVNSCLPTQAQADAAFDATLAAGGYSDACGGVVTAEMVSAVVSGTKCSWSILYTFKVKDECNNYTANQTYTRSGSDQTAPTGTNPTAITGVNSCLPTQTQADAAFDATLAAGGYSDACGGVVTAEMVSAVVSGTKCAWSILYTFRVKDECNNYTANQTYTRSGSDQTAPTGTNPTAITGVNSCLPTQTQADVAFDATLAAGGYSDACGGVVTAEIVSAVVSGTTCSWSILYTFRVKDECNNYTANQTYTRSGSDQTAPGLTGTIPSGGTGINACSAPAGPTTADIASQYTDACGGAITVVKTIGSQTIGVCGWSVTYHYTIRDQCNNYATAVDITYSGSDQTAPALTGTIPSGGTGINACSAPAGPTTADIASQYTDACGGAITVVKTIGSQTIGVCGWSVTYHYTIRDQCNNYATAVDITYSGSDQTAPALTGTIPSGGTGINACSAPAGPTTADIASQYTDACGGAITVVKTIGSQTIGVCGWSVTYHYTIRDQCNNYATAVDITYSGSDQTAPALTGTIPSGGTGINACSAPAGPTTADIASQYTDACGGAITVVKTIGSQTIGVCGWSVTYHYTIRDQCNNYATAVDITYSGSDQTAPALTGTIPSGGTGINACSAPAGPTTADIASQYTDACGGAITVVKTIGSQTIGVCGWSVTYHYTIRDQCNNYATAVDITYSGSDQTAPALTGTIPSGGTGINACSAPAGPTTADIASQYTDACGGAITVVKTIGSQTIGVCGWSVTYHYTIRDQCNNYATAVDITYSGSDQTAPVIAVCKPNATRLFDFAETNYTVQGTEFDVSATDNCNLASMVYTLSGATTVAYNLANTTLANVDLNGGVTCVTWTATDACGNTNTCKFFVTVNLRPTTLTYTGDGTEQYSDKQRLTATLIDVTSGNPIAGGTVSFTIGSQSISDGPGAPGNGTNTSGVADTCLILTQGPGSYTVASSFAGDATYSSSSDSDPFTISKEDARVLYNGDIIKATANATTYSASFTLSTKVMDITVPQSPADPAFDNYPGDISKAKVMFVDRDNSNAPISGWLPVSIVDPSDLKIGNAIFPGYVIGGLSSSTPSKQVTVGIIVDYGYYIRNSDDDDVVLTVYLPVGDFITGGGYITPYESVGTKASDDGKKANFGFNVKFGNGGKNLQGSMNIIFRRTESDLLVHNYQIKANSMQSLGVNATNPNRQTAEYVSKVTLKDLTNPTSLDPDLGGNRMLYVKMIDNGEPGVNDSISFVIVAGNANPNILSNVIWSSNWVGSMTQMVRLGGGNLQVHSGFSVSGSAVSTGPGGMKSTAEAEQTPIVITALTAKAFPNPSETYFNLMVESGNAKDEVQVMVYNTSGILVHQAKGVANRNYKFGEGWVSGMYFVQVRQGKEVKTLELMKQ